MENNYTSSINSAHENGADGKSYSPAMFDEKFYKRLGWDFSNIWEWDDKENKPILKREKIKEESEEIFSDKIDLNKILEDNIWI